MDDSERRLVESHEEKAAIVYDSRSGRNGRPQSRVHVGTELSFYNVNYTVPVKEKGQRFQKPLIRNAR